MRNTNTQESVKSDGVKGKIKRAVALAGAVILLLMYILTFVFALTDNPDTMNLFKASFVMTVILPILLYAYQLVYRVLSGRNNMPGNSPDVNITDDGNTTEDDGE